MTTNTLAVELRTFLGTMDRSIVYDALEAAVNEINRLSEFAADLAEVNASNLSSLSYEFSGKSSSAIEAEYQEELSSTLQEIYDA